MEQATHKRPRLSDRELLQLVLAQIQQHIGQMRSSLEAAQCALESARLDLIQDSGWLAAQSCLDAIQSSVDDVTQEVGDAQGVLTAIAQLVYSRAVADTRADVADAFGEGQQLVARKSLRSN